MSSRAATIPEKTAHPLTGRARWVAAVLLIVGPALQVVEFLLETPIDDPARRVDYWAEHSTQIGLSMAAGLLAVPFLIGAFGATVLLCRSYSPRVAGAAAVLLTLAMVGLAAIHGLEGAAYGLLRSGDRAAAITVLTGDDPGLPGVALLVTFLVGAVLGVPMLAAAMWRSPLIPRPAPVFVLAFIVLDLAGFGVLAHTLNLVGLGLVAYAVVTGYRRGSAVLPMRLSRRRLGHST